MLMPYGQKRGENCISIDIYALRAKEKKFKPFLNLNKQQKKIIYFKSA
jgi:hypothetical protein